MNMEQQPLSIWQTSININILSCVCFFFQKSITSLVADFGILRPGKDNRSCMFFSMYIFVWSTCVGKCNSFAAKRWARKITHIYIYVYLIFIYIYIYYIFFARFTNSSGYCKHKFIMFVLTHGQLPTLSGLGKIGDAEEQVAGLQQMLVEKKSGSLCDVKVM